MEKIRVFLADSQALYREGVHAALLKEGDMEVVGEAHDGEAAFDQIKFLSPDVVIVDCEIPPMGAPDLTRQIKRHLPALAVIILSSCEDDDHLFHAIQAGAAGYLIKVASGQDLALQIREACQGEYPINEYLLSKPAVALNVLRQFQDLLLVEEEVEPLLSPLSPRETEILEHIARGNSNKEIAYTIGICNQTVKNHVTSIMRKLTANDRTHAVVLALRHGLIKVC